MCWKYTSLFLVVTAGLEHGCGLLEGRVAGTLASCREVSPEVSADCS